MHDISLETKTQKYSGLFKTMNVKKSNHYQQKESISKITEEYSSLIKLSSPSDVELDRIEQIMELAVYDTELNNLINQVDEQYALEMNLLEDDHLDHLSIEKSKNISNVISFPHSVVLDSKKKRQIFKYDTRLAISYFVAGGLFVFAGVTGLCNMLKDKELVIDDKQQTKQVFIATPAVQTSDNQMSVCSSEKKTPNPKIKDYYVTFTQLENQVKMQKLQPLEIKSKVRQLQKQAERRQKKAEQEQLYAEIKKTQAERQKNYDLAHSLQAKAQSSLEESQQWLCLSRQMLELSRH